MLTVEKVDYVDAAIRVLLVEDHAMVRTGLQMLLKDAAGITVVGEAENGRDAVEFAASQAADVVVMDISMPGLNGLEATHRISRANPSTKILVLSMHSNEEFVLQALRQGAAGYLVKDALAGELEQAIRTVAQGETYLGASLDADRIKSYLDSSSKLDSTFDRLTPRQREILQLVVEGNKTREIADQLSVSVKTVETHRAQLMDRLGIRDVAGLVRYAIRMGLISPEQ